MGMVVMSKRELNRLDVLARLDGDRLTARAAAELMTITPRQAYRLLRRYRDGGASAVANQRRGRPSNNRLLDVVRDHAIALVRERARVLQEQGQRSSSLPRPEANASS
jgi:transposase